MDSVKRKRIFIVILVILILIGIVIYVRKKKSGDERTINKENVPLEVLLQVKKTHEQEIAKAESFEGGGNGFPLVLGSEGENVNRLQRALGVKETGKLDKSTLNSFERIMADMGIDDLSKVSEASIILIEAYADKKDVKDFIEGDVVVANGKIVAERVNVRRNPKGTIIQLQPTKDYKGFNSGEKIGVLAKKISDDMGLTKNDFGDFFLVQLSKVKKK
jgi:hypothetical protein